MNIFHNNLLNQTLPHFKQNIQKGIAHIAVLLLLLVGLGVGLYLTSQTQIFKPKASESSINQGLVGYWKFDEASGSAVLDSSGNNNNGLWKGSLGNQWGQGKFGNAGNYNGLNNTVIVTDNTSLTPAGSLTVAAWVKRGSDKGTTYAIVTKGNVGSESKNASYGLLLGSDNRYIFRVSPNGTNYAHLATTKAYTDMNWHHIVGVFTPSISQPSSPNPAGTMSIYVDGQLASKPLTNAPTPLFVTASPLYIGSSITNAGNLAWYWNGQLEEVRVYNKALSASEVFQLYNYNPSAIPSPSPSPVTPNVAVIEVENAMNATEIEKKVAQEFYKNHQDKYDFLGILFDFNRRSFYHQSVQNKVTGIGSQNWKAEAGIPKLDENPIFDKSRDYGSNGKLLGIGVMGPIEDYIGRPYYPSWLEEVIGHQFGIFVGGAPGSSDPLPINHESWGHWNNCLSIPKSDPSQPYWHARFWKDNKDGTWTRIDGNEDFSKPMRFDPFMLYLMGFLPPEKVPNATLLIPEGGYKQELCFPGKTIKATAKEITINDIIKRYGPRVPSYQDSQKEFSTAFILVVEKGKQPTPGAIDKLIEWDKKFPEVIRQATVY